LLFIRRIGYFYYGEQMMKLLVKCCILLTIIFGCNGCATQQTVPKEIKIPVPVSCPAPQIPSKPHLPISDINANSSPDTIMKAYVTSVRILIGYSNQLRTILKSYQNSQLP
jgi:hypothetical protein